MSLLVTKNSGVPQLSGINYPHLACFIDAGKTRMKSKKRSSSIPRYQSETWRTDDDPTAKEKAPASYSFNRLLPVASAPTVREQTRVLELLGRINYKIIEGKRVYIEAGGIVYKTLYGGYWRSVFTGVEHYLFRCEQVSGAVWAAEEDAETEVDLPISFSSDGWTANGHSLSFILANDQKVLKRRRREIVRKISRRWRAGQLFGVR